MSDTQDKSTKQEIEQVESVNQVNQSEDDLSFKQYTEKDEAKKKSIFIRFKDSIYQKPETTVNAWHLLTNLTNTQRITFAAGKNTSSLFIVFYTNTIFSILWLDFGCF